MAKKDAKPSTTKCEITRKHFKEHAKPMSVTINGIPFAAAPKDFSTKSLGWNINDKIQQFEIGGKLVKIQVGLNLTIVGSKELPE